MNPTLTRIHDELGLRINDGKYLGDYTEIVKNVIGDPDNLDSHTLHLVQAEIQALQFIIRENVLKPMFVSTDKNGMSIEYPDIKTFSDDQLNYLIERQSDCNSLVLKARYSHTLWLSKRKKINYAKAAIDSYIQLSELYSHLDLADKKRDYWLQFIETIKNLIPLSSSVNHRLDEVRALVIEYCLSYPMKSEAVSVVRKELAQMMHEQKSIFKSSDFSRIITSLEEVYIKVKSNQLHHAVEILEVMIAIAQKLALDLVPMKRQMAELWEQMARERGTDAAIVSTDFCMKAILIYEEIKDHKKVKELYKFYDELRNSVELHSIPLKFDGKVLFKFAEDLSNEVAEFDVESIIQFLMFNNQVIPQKSEIIKSINDSKGDFLRFVHTSVFDDQGNTHRHYSTENEKSIEQIMLVYTIWIQHCIHIINSTLTKSIKSRKLTYNSVLQYLIKESWFGQELTTGRMDTKRQHKWLSIIAPGIVDFFVTMDGLIYAGKVFNVTTSLDSLTTKIEGIIRSLAEYKGIPTFIIKRDNLGREVSEEKDIMRLLTEPEIVELIGEDDIFFLRYIFTEKGGLNLRNRVAHSLLSFDQYTIGNLMLVFIAILRLGRYKLKAKTDANRDI